MNRLDVLEPASACDLPRVLWQSDRTRIVRRLSADGRERLIIKHAFGPDATRRLRHETQLLERLAGIEGLPQLRPMPDASHGIAMRDDGGTSLADVLAQGRLSIDEAAHIGLGIARVLVQVHRQGIIHKDINPTNVLLAGTPAQPLLIDFNIASSFAEEHPTFTHQTEIVGTLAYMAPEQTGRTGRPVDQRSDLYALGVTLYEMTTGRRPFLQDDALELIHAHLVHMPVAPVDAAPDVPQALSDIVMRLLAKEADARYQSAEGLVDDLSRLIERRARGEHGAFALGTRDFARRLSPPSRPVGRASEIATLRDAFEASLRGAARGVLVTGAPGVGKTTLIAELRPIVTQCRGWFVSGKFDQTRSDVASSALLLALRALGRLLLSEPEEVLDVLRTRLRSALGQNTGLVAAMLPEFGMLLDTAADVGQGTPAEIEARLFHSGLSLLRCIASPQRPVVMVIDDLQWAAHASVRFFNTILADSALDGLLLVGAYRESEVDASHPLTPMIEHWQQLPLPPRRLQLHNLALRNMGELLGEMLRMPPERTAGLAESVAQRTAGNPYDTVELINALRRDGTLHLGPHGWTWDTAAIRQFIGHGDVVQLLSARIDALPERSQALMYTMACLAGEIDVRMLLAACDSTLDELESWLAAPLEDGLLVMEQGTRLGAIGQVRFKHDRVQQATYARLGDVQRRAIHLQAARRLADIAEFAHVAAEQYLPVVDALTDEAEARRAVTLFGSAAQQAVNVNYAVAERLLTAAVALLTPIARAEDSTQLVGLLNERAIVLYSLGRFTDCDAVYDTVMQLSDDPTLMLPTLRVHINSLVSRGRAGDALQLGRAHLERLMLSMESASLPDADVMWARAQQWSRSLDLSADLRRAPSADVRVETAAELLHTMSLPAYFCGAAQVEPITLLSQHLWAHYGPQRGLIVALSLSPVAAIGQRGDYRFGYDAARHVMAFSQARQHDSPTALARSTLSHFYRHWFEPLEVCLAEFQQMRETLLRTGNPQTAAFTYAGSVIALLECAPSLEHVEVELRAAEALSARVGNRITTAYFVSYAQLVRTFCGKTARRGEFVDDQFDEATYLAGPGRVNAVASLHHVNRAFAAAVFGDHDALVQHAQRGWELFEHDAIYRAAVSCVLQALSLVQQAHRADAAERGALLVRFDACHQWLHARAVDAPANFKHLAMWMDAERSWFDEDAWRTAQAFEAAIDETQRYQRPWHLALMCERAAAFHLSLGLPAFGRQLLVQAHACYTQWGATAKVAALEDDHAFLKPIHHPASDVTGTSRLAESVDMMGILRASQALSSETNLERLKTRVCELLGALSGATSVSLVLRRGDSTHWFFESGGGTSVALDQAGNLLPLSTIRYVQRTRSPLVIDDTRLDDRFVLDPYVARLGACSLLVVPILSQGGLRAIAVLENRSGRGAFAVGRLDAVQLIAGQLAVSLENATLYESLERKVTERTAALQDANRQLAELSVTDALTGLANRRRFTEVLDIEWRRALRSGGSLALVMVDIDQFKAYNDHYGHLGGDECIRRVAQALRGSVRPASDLAARYGGEEFAIVLPSTDLTGAVTAAERLRAAVEALAMPHKPSRHGMVTISAGVASLMPNESNRSSDLLQAADAALYDAKHAGRNRVVSG